MKLLKHLFLFGIVFLMAHCTKDNNDLDKEPIVEINLNKIETDTLTNFSSSGLKVNNILTDNEGIMWFATNEGLFSFDKDMWLTYTDSAFKQEITCLEQTSENKMYVGTYNGIIIIDLNNDADSIAAKLTIENSDLISDSIHFISVGPKQKIWVGTDVGMCYFNNGNIVTDIIIEFNYDNMREIAFVNNQYYVATYGRALYNAYYNPETDAITRATKMMEEFNGELTTDSIHCVLADSKNQLWFGTSLGLTKMVEGGTHVKDGTFEYFYQDQKVTRLFEAKNGDIWVGKVYGISKFDGAEWKDIAFENGIGSSVLSFAEDTDGSIWIGTNDGISSYNGTSWTLF